MAMLDDDFKGFGTAVKFINYKWLKEQAEKTHKPMMVIVDELVDKERSKDESN